MLHTMPDQHVFVVRRRGIDSSMDFAHARLVCLDPACDVSVVVDAHPAGALDGLIATLTAERPPTEGEVTPHAPRDVEAA